MRMSLLTCCVCNRTTALWPAPGRNRLWTQMHHSDVLGATVHPSCLEAEMIQYEEAYQLNLDPLRERFGFENMKEQHDGYKAHT